MKERVRGIVIDGDKITLLKRVKGDHVFYVFPGGGVEEGEDIEVALKREMMEELGVDVLVDKILTQRINARYRPKQLEHFVVCTTKSGVLGTGHGPEFQSDSHYEGTHEPIQVLISEMRDMPILPLDIKNLVIQELNE
ncbi:NUDIX domain-containing protein [Patescibacteria group bacterium]|nr:NUDIX domain-containing protein [Patescibacteria group bacterium]